LETCIVLPAADEKQNASSSAPVRLFAIQASTYKSRQLLSTPLLTLFYLCPRLAALRYIPHGNAHCGCLCSSWLAAAPRTTWAQSKTHTILKPWCIF